MAWGSGLNDFGETNKQPGVIGKEEISESVNEGGDMVSKCDAINKTCYMINNTLKPI